MKTERDLLKLKEGIEEAKRTTAKLEGQISALQQQLQEEFGCMTVKDAEVKLNKMNVEISELTTLIENKIEQLEERFNL